jgi:hypothetical protein
MAVASLPLETRYHRLEITNRWLVILSGLVIVALLIVAAPMVLDRFGGLSANEQIAQRVALAPNTGATAPTAAIYASDAVWQGWDGTVLTGADAIIAAGTPWVTVTLKGDPITLGNFVLVNFSWEAKDASGSGDGAFLFTFDDAGLVTLVQQTITFN